MGHVYYHLPGDKQFSLDFVHPDPDEIVSQIVGYGDDVAVKVQKYDIDETFYVIYISRVGGGSVQEIDFDLNESLSEMSADNSTITVRLEIHGESRRKLRASAPGGCQSRVIIGRARLETFASIRDVAWRNNSSQWVPIRQR